MDKEYQEIKLPNGDIFRFRPISEYGFHPCETIENVYPTAFMTPEEITQRNQRRRDFEEFLNPNSINKTNY